MKYLKLPLLTGYADADTILTHASFEVLIKFVDEEMERCYWFPNNNETRKLLVDGQTTQEEIDTYRQAKKDIMSIYNYWKKVNEADFYEKNDPIDLEGVPSLDMIFEPIEGSTNQRGIFTYGDGSEKDEKAYRKASRAHVKWEAKQRQLEEDMLIKLVKVRGFLWS